MAITVPSLVISSKWFIRDNNILTLTFVIPKAVVIILSLKSASVTTCRLVAIKQMTLFMPPRSKIGEHIVFVLSVSLSIRHSIILSETLTLPITFEQ